MDCAMNAWRLYAVLDIAEMECRSQVKPSSAHGHEAVPCLLRPPSNMSSILTSAPPSPSPVSFGSSRASPLDSNELEQPAVQANIDPEAKATRHSQYYFKDGNVVFQVSQCPHRPCICILKRTPPID
ncbi:hypothetical protein FIBSPDRAFT_96963 [Athelia psychrophila]|uniref:Uncharacterized protein n=1 Tax=Athelia psychrophila TaxID=1759441 RepID=A0A167SU69_9AGAM|nr:hypothetical protein FIBSPDRAFT_96963 [Fibularhizoctonia sp. CBS 109695]